MISYVYLKFYGDNDLISVLHSIIICSIIFADVKVWVINVQSCALNVFLHKMSGWLAENLAVNKTEQQLLQNYPVMTFSIFHTFQIILNNMGGWVWFIWIWNWSIIMYVMIHDDRKCVVKVRTLTK